MKTIPTALVLSGLALLTWFFRERARWTQVSDRFPQCQYPLALSVSSAIWIECLNRPQMSREAILEQLDHVQSERTPISRDIVRCRDRSRVSEPISSISKNVAGAPPLIHFGELLRIDSACNLSRRPMPSAIRIVLGLPLELNRASEAELTLLPGIGKTIARRLIQRRGQGCYRTWQDLLEVRGIGPKTVQRLKREGSLVCPQPGGLLPARIPKPPQTTGSPKVTAPPKATAPLNGRAASVAPI